MLLVRIDPLSKEPVYKQVARQVIELVESDALQEGEILPPTRELAERLSVSRFTVTQAYRELWAKGYVDSRPGSYTRVRRRPKIAALPRGQRRAGERVDGLFSAGARAVAESLSLATFPVDRVEDESLIDFTPMALDHRLFPVDELKTCFDRALTHKHAALLNYADPAGYRPLREYVAGRMRAHSVEAEPEEVLITHGSLQALELVAKLFADRGRTVALEQPTFSSVMPLFLLQGVCLGTVAMTESGMDLDKLERLLIGRAGKKDAAALVYSIPTFHNPSGITTGQPHRERLLALCERYRVPLVEDSFQEEITYFGKAVLPIKSMDNRGLVLYLGSFSKVLFPGVRLGWIVARREFIGALTLIKRVGDISCSPLMQAALYRFCESGSYELHLRRVNREFSRRMKLAIDSLREHLPAERASFTEPSGGYLIWIRLRGIRKGEGDILAALKEHGVLAAPGSLFFARPPRERFIRLSISSLGPSEIAEGARRLGEALKSL